MARQKITEYKAKKIILAELGLQFSSVAVDIEHVGENLAEYISTNLDPQEKYVIKVDQGVKKRMKLGLVAIGDDKTGVLGANVTEKLKELAQTGYTKFIVEKFLPHSSEQEKYISLELTREGVVCNYSTSGGIDIEENKESVISVVIEADDAVRVTEVAKALGIAPEFLQKLLAAFKKYYISFLEINPLIVIDSEPYLLDLAVMVDSTGAFFVGSLGDGDEVWEGADFVFGKQAQKTQEEQNIIELANKSLAALKFDLLNPDGSIWLLLSGGGASIALADEAYNQGLGKELANYGEYSGNPNAEETYIYTTNMLQLLCKGKAKQKVLVIAGGVANFTDVRVTFSGVIRALADFKAELKAQNIKVFVRRGGPFQEEGLMMMRDFLEKSELLGKVYGPELEMTDIVRQAIQHLKSAN